MAFHNLCLLAIVLLASVGAEIYDQGPQTFFATSAIKRSPSPQPEPHLNANKEYVLYLTPAQAKALEIGGAFVKPHPEYEPETSENRGPRVTEKQNESSEEDNNNEEEPKKPSISELEEIFKILNQHNIVEELEKLQEERATEKPREIPGRFNVTPKPQPEEKKYFAPASNDWVPSKSYSYVHFIRNLDEPQTLKPKPYRVQPPSSLTKKQESAENLEENSAEEAPESENQEEKISILNGLNGVAHIIQQRNRLLKNELELQTKLREIQDAPKHNDQKFAIEIEKLRSNLEKQNALSKAEALAKSAPILIKEQITANRRPVEAAKNAEVPATRPVLVHIPPFEVKVPHSYAVPVVQYVRPSPAPVVTTESNEAETPAPVEERRVPLTKNVYVKVNRPYLVERLVPVQVRKEISENEPLQRPEKVTILRHLWEH